MIVADGKGNELKRTAFGNRLYWGKYVLLRTDAHDLEPGEQIASQIELTRIYEVTQPGTYYARASRGRTSPDLDEEAKSTVEEEKRPIARAFSNPIQFTVVP